MGAGVGALVGLAAGALVAERNLTFENREATASERIASARDIANFLNEVANHAEQLGKQNRRKIIKLGQLYESGQITAGQYRAETANMRQDTELIRKRADEARDAKQRLQSSSSDLSQLTAEERTIDQAQRRLERAAEDLEAALGRVPLG
jgi:DNA repair exonuclease SbcCD ATPase subunit